MLGKTLDNDNLLLVENQHSFCEINHMPLLQTSYKPLLIREEEREEEEERERGRGGEKEEGLVHSSKS